MSSVFQLLVVAGGGSGGNNNTTNGNGGGGGGGVLHGTAINLDGGTNYTVSIGAGGANVARSTIGIGNRGGDSYLGAYVAKGGGGGGSTGASPTSNQAGGSGGGSAAQQNTTLNVSTQTSYGGATGYGNPGAAMGYTWTGGGGGGAGTPGVNGSSGNPGGNGGQGIAISITGTTVYYAGGGGGSGNSSERAGDGFHGGGRGEGTTTYYNYDYYPVVVNSTTGGSSTPNALVNTGGGGGGGSYWSGYWYSGSGTGGSGIIIIKYPDTFSAATVTGSPTVSVSGGFRTYTFTSSGTFQPPPTGPANTVAPVVSGTLEVGQTLTCTTGSWNGTDPISYAYQWKRGGINIAGANSTTYTLVTADGDYYISCAVTATDIYASDTTSSNSVFVTAPTSRYLEYLLVAGGGGGGTKVGGGGGGGGLLHANTVSVSEGDAEFTTSGTYTWTAPAGVTSVCAVCVGGGGGGGYQWSSGGGGGGGLGWKNDITVVPGQSYTVVVGVGGTSNANATNAGSEGGNSYFISLETVAGYGGGRGGPNSTAASNGYGGGYAGDGGGRGGDGAYEGSWTRAGAGAGGYSGRGGEGAVSGGSYPATGSGAGAGGGHYSSTYGVPAGGGVGIYGRGADGVPRGQYLGGGGGSGGANGTGGEGSGESSYRAINGGAFGGGGGGSGTSYGGGFGGGGAVRIIWGAGRSFPTSASASTNTVVSTPLVPKGLYSVIVGAGGAGATAGSSDAGVRGSNSIFGNITAITGNTSALFGNLTAIGGGGGGSRNDTTSSPALSGGSGGGANGYAGAVGGAPTSGQGRRGGNAGGTNYAGGGGGAATAGSPGVSGSATGNGGTGLEDTILTTSYYWAGGGGGGGYSTTGGNGGLGGGGGGALGVTTGGSGINAGSPGGGGSVSISTTNIAGGAGGTNTGGGGGGGSLGTATNAGGNGGSGIVILRYPDTKNDALYTTNLDAGYPVTTGGYKIYKWSTSGSIQFGATGGPVNTVLPAITVTSGSVENGLPNAVLTCGTGTWTGDPTITYTYQWYRSGVLIAGAIGNTYTTLYTDAFRTLTCSVTATNSVDTLTLFSSNGAFVLINGFVKLSKEEGFGANLATSVTGSANTTLTESVTVLSNVGILTDNSEGLNKLTSLAISVTDSANTTLTESVTVLSNVGMLTDNSEGLNKLTSLATIPATTFAYTDGVPVIVSNTAAASSTQTWYVG